MATPSPTAPDTRVSWSPRWQSRGKHLENRAFRLGIALASAKMAPYSTTTTRGVAIRPPSGPEPGWGWFAGGDPINALDLLLGEDKPWLRRSRWSMTTATS